MCGPPGGCQLAGTTTHQHEIESGAVFRTPRFYYIYLRFQTHLQPSDLAVLICCKLASAPDNLPEPVRY